MASDEAALIEAARAGDGAALEELLSRYEPRLLRFVSRLCRHDADAEDVLQESLLAAARSLRDFRGDASVSTWLYTIARSYCIKKRRRSKIAPKAHLSIDAPGSVPELPDPAPGPEAELENARLSEALDAAVATLEPSQREVLVLRDVEGLHAVEVASVLGLSVQAVKSRLHRARVAVRARLLPVLGRASRSPGCPDIASLFSRHLEGEIAPKACAEMERHLDGCAVCRAECETLRSVLRLCAAAPAPRVPRPLQESIRRGIRQLGARKA